MSTCDCFFNYFIRGIKYYNKIICVPFRNEGDQILYLLI